MDNVRMGSREDSVLYRWIAELARSATARVGSGSPSFVIHWQGLGGSSKTTESSIYTQNKSQKANSYPRGKGERTAAALGVYPTSIMLTMSKLTTS